MAIITISRGTFSGGSELAQRVAALLGYQCTSREVILEAAWGSGIPAEEITNAMEKRPSFWHRVMGQRTAYLTLVRAALCEHARGGQLVYHGHVGHLLLPGIVHVVRVRVIADMPFRIQAALPQHGTVTPPWPTSRKWIRSGANGFAFCSVSNGMTRSCMISS